MPSEIRRSTEENKELKCTVLIRFSGEGCRPLLNLHFLVCCFTQAILDQLKLAGLQDQKTFWTKLQLIFSYFGICFFFLIFKLNFI